MLRKFFLSALALGAFGAMTLPAEKAEAGGPRVRYHSHSHSFYAGPTAIHRSRSTVYVAPPLPIYGRPHSSFYRPVPVHVYRPVPAPVHVYRPYVDPFYDPRGYYGSGFGYGNGAFVGSPGFSFHIGF